MIYCSLKVVCLDDAGFLKSNNYSCILWIHCKLMSDIVCGTSQWMLFQTFLLLLEFLLHVCTPCVTAPQFLDIVIPLPIRPICSPKSLDLPALPKTYSFDSVLLSVKVCNKPRAPDCGAWLSLWLGANLVRTTSVK